MQYNSQGLFNVPDLILQPGQKLKVFLACILVEIIECHNITTTPQNEKSIPHLALSLKLNALQPLVLSRLAYAYLELEDWTNCARTYRQLCTLDNEVRTPVTKLDVLCHYVCSIMGFFFIHF